MKAILEMAFLFPIRSPNFAAISSMNYAETLTYLYQNLPMFQRVGAVAFKSDLTNTLSLCKALGNPQNKFKSIHIAGTNGKGSSSHMLASVLQAAGYKTGLYTSPHLKEFTERIRINGIEVDQDFVVDFVARIKPLIEEIQPSFFEITVAMAFDYFAYQKVDVAVIEVGLGGRLDSTNIITPTLSLITNISWDHMDLLGDTLKKIAGEKAGIIKTNVPVVIGERQPEVEEVFRVKSQECNSRITFASDLYNVTQESEGSYSIRHDDHHYTVEVDLKGGYQTRNIAGVLACVSELRKMGFIISDQQIAIGLKNVMQRTGLRGRWQILGRNPLIICDTGHNEAGISEIMKQINQTRHHQLHMVLGFVRDKDISRVLSLLPTSATYYFCAASIPRAMPSEELKQKAEGVGLNGNAFRNVNDAIRAAKANSAYDDLIFVGGSTFVVAEVEDL
jgi:dihydrofolate synthase/folylpolyglutamate synthase